MRPILIALLTVLACLVCAPAVEAQCRGGSCSVRPARAAASVVRGVRERRRERRGVARILGR